MKISADITDAARKRWLNWKIALMYSVVTVFVPLLSLALYERNLSGVDLFQHLFANSDRYLEILMVFGAFGVFGHTFIFRTLAYMESQKELKSNEAVTPRQPDGDAA